MKVVLLYGPPAAGKLTVAEELEKLTGFKLFHNHLTVNPVHALSEFGSRIHPRSALDPSRALSIDNTEVPAAEAARRIVQHYGL